MIKVFSVSEMIAAEKAADAAGNTYDRMMETAGKAVAKAILDRKPVAGLNITILVGPGNNGGDGLVAGRHLANSGADVTFYLYRDRDPANDHNYAQVQEMGLTVVLAEYDQRYRVLRHRIQITDIIIDALLGTGVSGPVTGQMAKLMAQIQSAIRESRQLLDTEPQMISVAALNQDGIYRDSGDHFEPDKTVSKPYVVAVDCPSGLNCDSGALDDLAISAHLTVTFAGPKRGHFIFPGAAACGELVVADIGISNDLAEVRDVSLELATYHQARKLLPARRADGHKGTFGWVLIAAGSSRYWGAAALAGRAAYRSGAGLVALAVPATIRSALAGQLPEATYPLIDEVNTLGQAAALQLLNEMELYKALLIGPGLHQAEPFLNTLLETDHLSLLPPMVIDADGLNLLAQIPNWHERVPENTILTPHPGEMARLMGVPLAQVRALDRVELAQEMAAKWRCVVLLKGAYSIIASPDGRAILLPFANPALATAGSGDILSGIIVALLGQGLQPFDAAVLGGFMHGAAASVPGVEAGLLAGEIADWIPEIWHNLQDGTSAS